MTDAVRTEHLDKQFRIGVLGYGYDTLRERIADVARAPARRVLGRPPPAAPATAPCPSASPASPGLRLVGSSADHGRQPRRARWCTRSTTSACASDRARSSASSATTGPARAPR